LKEKIKEDKETKKIDRGQVSKRKKTLMGALEHLMEKKEEQVAKSLKCGLCGPRVLAPGLRSRVSKSHGMINRGLEELRGRR
jgi:hypothetical protein